MDMGCRDGRLTSRDADLVELERDVSDRIEVRHVGPHLLIDDETSGRVGLGAQPDMAERMVPMTVTVRPARENLQSSRRAFLSTPSRKGTSRLRVVLRSRCQRPAVRA
jgi:hypothetical protein